MNNPSWLDGVQRFDAAGDDVGSALSAIASAMDEEAVPELVVGAIGGAAVSGVSGSGTEYVVYVSSGVREQDLAQVAEAYGVPVEQVSLLPAAEMLQTQYRGIASCATQW